MHIGPCVINIGANESAWQGSLTLMRLMRPDLIKIPIETAFSPFPSRIRAVADEFKPKRFVMSCGMEAIESGWERVKFLINQQMATIDAHPEIEFVIELGNEPQYHEPPWGKARDAWGYRSICLQLAGKIRELGTPNLKVGVSMPVYLDAAKDVWLAGDQWGRLCDQADYACTHYYGFEYIGDAAGSGKDHGAHWGPIYQMLLEAGARIIFTEIGIDSPSSSLATKSARLLDWLTKQPAQVVGAAIWCVGPWPNMGLDPEGARVYGRRDQPKESGPVGETIYGIRGLIDIRNQLATDYSAGHGPHVQNALKDKWGLVVHYDGPPVDQTRDPVEVLTADAAYHVKKVWGYTSLGKPLLGDGIQYHLGIDQQGRKYLLRDVTRTLWHCAAWPQNATALAIHVNIGGDQRASAAALKALQEIADDWFAAGHGSRKDLWGHEELSPTSCPGTLMHDFVYPYREGMQVTAEGQWFPETQHYIGGGFYTYWLNHGGLAQFGFPLTDEMAEVCEDGAEHTVQYFERARFEYWPQNQPPYDVLLTRLGAEAYERKYGGQK